MRKKLLSAFAVFTVFFGTLISVAAADAPSTNTNSPRYWESILDPGTRCYKHDGASSHGYVTYDELSVVLYEFNQNWPGDHWEALIVKAGSEDIGHGPGNAFYYHPDHGVPYFGPLNAGGQQAAVSHWIVCKGTTPPDTTTTVPPSTTTTTLPPSTTTSTTTSTTVPPSTTTTTVPPTTTTTSTTVPPTTTTLPPTTTTTVPPSTTTTTVPVTTTTLPPTTTTTTTIPETTTTTVPETTTTTIPETTTTTLPETTTTTTEPENTTTTTTLPELPETGINTDQAAIIGALFLLVGIVLVVAARRESEVVNP